jgi:hypothetical protein
MTESTCTERELEARRANARKSTGPRTDAGKQRARLNALKHGGYATDEVFADSLKALGEDPAEFDSLLASLVEAREPADAVESLLVEEVAQLYWKRTRLDRKETALEAAQLRQYDEDRRLRRMRARREYNDMPQGLMNQEGLRRNLTTCGRFQDALRLLREAHAMAQRNEFTDEFNGKVRFLYASYYDVGSVLRMDQPDMRRATPGTPEFESRKVNIETILEAEIRAVEAEYQLFIERNAEDDANERLAAGMLPLDQWTAITRQQNALDRALDRKMRLLERIQNDRRKRERQLAVEPSAEHAPVTERSEDVVENTESAVSELPFVMAPVTMNPVVLPSTIAARTAGIVQTVS